jgi:hypothetical protein
MGATQTVYDVITTSNARDGPFTPETVTDDAGTTSHTQDGPFTPETVTDVITTSHSQSVYTATTKTEQVSADAPLFPTQDIIDKTEQVSADAPLFPTQDTIDFTERVYSEITEPSFATVAGRSSSNAAKMISSGLL